MAMPEQELSVSTPPGPLDRRVSSPPPPLGGGEDQQRSTEAAAFVTDGAASVIPPPHAQASSLWGPLRRERGMHTGLQGVVGN